MRSVRVAWAFLTRLPGGTHAESQADVARAIPWLPVVGLMVGGLVGLSYWGLAEVVNPVVAAILAVSLSALVTGGFHEDGLADTFDSVGGYSRARRLEIMHDSTVGTFGALALIIVTGLKVAALVSLNGANGFVALVAAHSIGRAAAVAVMQAGPEASESGLVPDKARHYPVAMFVSVGTTLVFAFAIGLPTAISVSAAAVVAVVMTGFARRQFGGTTGDVLGATEQICEISTLIIVSELAANNGWLWG